MGHEPSLSFDPLDLSNAMPMWCDLLQGFSRKTTFCAPADPAAIAAVEAALGVGFPPELTALLAETDGVKDEFGCWLVWPLAHFRSENVAFRTEEHYQRLYMPFDHLLFFADDGCGNYYAFPLRGVRRSDVFVWLHEDDSRTWEAESLRAFLVLLSSPDS